MISPFPLIAPLDIPLSTIMAASAIQTVPFNPFITNLPTATIPHPFMTNPLIPPYPNVVSYQDVNNDRNLKSQVLEYFYNKLLNNWLKFHYTDLYYMITVSNGKASLIKNISEIENNKKNDRSDNDIKYEFLVDNYLRKKDVYSLLSKFRKLNTLNWWDLKQHSEKVRLFIHHKVKQYIRYEITN